VSSSTGDSASRGSRGWHGSGVRERRVAAHRHNRRPPANSRTTDRVTALCRAACSPALHDPVAGPVMVTRKPAAKLMTCPRPSRTGPAVPTALTHRATRSAGHSRIPRRARDRALPDRRRRARPGALTDRDLWSGDYELADSQSKLRVSHRLCGPTRLAGHPGRAPQRRQGRPSGSGTRALSCARWRPRRASAGCGA